MTKNTITCIQKIPKEKLRTLNIKLIGETDQERSKILQILTQEYGSISKIPQEKLQEIGYEIIKKETVYEVE